MLKDLTAEVNKLKTEHKALSGESRELMQEKSELREEKTSLKSDIENLNAQYQQRVRIMFPSWTAIDHSVVISPPYSYPVPIPIPPAPISIHPSLQPFPFFGNQNPGHIPNPRSMYLPYSTPTNPPVEPPSLYVLPCPTCLSKKNLKASRQVIEGPVMLKDVASLMTWLQSLNSRCLDHHQHNMITLLEEGRVSIQ